MGVVSFSGDVLLGRIARFFIFMSLSVCGSLALSPPAFAQGWCRSVQSPQIHVKTSTDQVRYDFSRSEKDLNNFSVDTVNPYGKSVITDVGGLMQGGISASQSMRYGTMTNNASREICYWYTNIDVMLHINPTIFIAREFPQGSCKHNAILAHEQQHVMIDREIVNKYAKIIGDALNNEVRKKSVFGPLPLSRQGELEAYLKSNMQNILTVYTQKMNDERKQRQQAFDNLKEYERVNHMCK